MIPKLSSEVPPPRGRNPTVYIETGDFLMYVDPCTKEGRVPRLGIVANVLDLIESKSSQAV
jgi:hypothetical protein